MAMFASGGAVFMVRRIHYDVIQHNTKTKTSTRERVPRHDVPLTWRAI